MSSDSKAKYVILVPDGMADEPIAEIGNRTPLEDADTPWMDAMASVGRVGLTRTVPDGMEPGSDVAILSILGYSPNEVYTGRAPFEAASMGIRLQENDVAFRLNLVTLDKNFTLMADHSADHISSGEAEELIETLKPLVESLGLAIYPGVSYRHLLVWNNGPDKCRTCPPHGFAGQPVDRLLPSGERADVLLRMIVKSWKVLDSHPINEHRVRRGLAPANSVWPWGQGKAPRIKTLTDKFGITGSVVAAVDLIKGIGKYAGLDALDVPGATGWIDTNYQGKVEAALDSLRTKDFVFLHVEAPDEASHSGQLDVKKKAIEDFDKKVVGSMLKGLGAFPRWRVLLMPDHRTLIATRAHSPEPVPFILLDSEKWNASDKDATIHFCEKAARASGNLVDNGTRMIQILLEKEDEPGSQA